MAVYGKYKEPWIPTKVKSKVSKNRTYEIKKTTVLTETVKDLQNTLFRHVKFDASAVEITSIWPDGSLTDAHKSPKQFAIQPHTANDLITIRVEPSKDSFAMLCTDSNSTSTVIEDGAYHGSSPGQLLGHFTNTAANVPERGQKGSRQVFFSYWIRIDQDNAENDGHTFAELQWDADGGWAQPMSSDPTIGFFINGSGAISIRFAEMHSSQDFGAANPGDDVVLIDGDPAWLEASSPNNLIIPGHWYHVVFGLDLPEVWDSDNLVNNAYLWVNGNPISLTPTSEGNFAYFTNWHFTRFGWVLGSIQNGYGSYRFDGGNHIVKRSSGFRGALGDFKVITQKCDTFAEIEGFAKFIYEADREGVYNLHSGIHSSSPRLEQIDLDNDSSYPPNFSMPAYTVFDKEGFYTQDSQVSLRSVNRFTEGALTDVSNAHNGVVEDWSEKASQRFVQSTYDSNTGVETITTMPHLRLNPSDSLLTNGNWYSDARSEFFPEDLDPVTGFVVTSTQADTLVPKTSDELYREHIVDTAIPAYRDATLGEEYKDTFVIEIPLPNLANLDLGTDLGQHVDGNERQFLYTTFDVNGAVIESNKNPTIQTSFNTMAYYNFKDSQWQHTVENQALASMSDEQGVWNGWDVGFGPMSGLVFPSDGRFLEQFADLYGRPTTWHGFPFHRKFESADGQTIDLSKYIDQDVILEGWEISTPVTPRMGYQQTTGGSEDTSRDGPSGFYSAMEKNPFWYGGHGEAAVIWDQKNYASPFEKREVTDQNGDLWRPNGTIPIGDSENTGATIGNQGILTKGVTAFLLKESQLVDATKQREKWATVPHLLGSFDFDQYADPKSDLTVSDYSPLISTTYSSADVFVNYFDPLGTTRSNPSRYDNASSRELIGYLQHVFHNDPEFNTVRDNWQRKYESDTAPSGEIEYTNFGVRPRWPTFSFAELLNRESYTYVDPSEPTGDLLRGNTKSFQLHVSGSMKIQTTYSGGFPMSMFHAASETQGALQDFVYDIDGSNTDLENASQNTPKITSLQLYPASAGSIANEFIQYDSVPVVAGKGKSTKVKVPMASVPNNGIAGVTTTIGDWNSKSLFEVDVSVNPDPDSDIILQPTDKLVLGIQDSVSTTFMSQQSLGSQNDNHFVRWGRNSLTIDATESGYLRLYVRKTRNDKPYNVVSDESNYNQNVNRDLGDHDVSDRYQVHDPRILSGSMADDIVGPMTFTDSIMDISVQLDDSLRSAPSLGIQASGHGVGSSFYKIANQTSWDKGYFALEEDVDSAVNFHLPIVWSSASRLVFKDRGQADSAPKRPAMTYHGLSGFDYANLGGREGYYWHQMWEALHWTISRRSPNAAAGKFPWENAYQGWTDVTDSWDGTLLDERRKQPYRTMPVGLIEELNPRSDATTSGWVVSTNSSGGNPVDKSIVGIDNPGHSAWNFSTFLPIFDRSVTTEMVTQATGIIVDFRLIRIDSRDANLPSWDVSTITDSSGVPVTLTGDGCRPQVRGVDLKVGDAFVFTPPAMETVTHPGHPVLVRLDKDSVLSSTEETDKWARWGVEEIDSNKKVTIFIVAGEIGWGLNVNKDETKVLGYNDASNMVTPAEIPPLSYNSVYAIISRILDIQCSLEDELLATVKDPWDGRWLEEGTENVHTSTSAPRTLNLQALFGGDLTLRMPEDPFLRELVKGEEANINQLVDFKLCGTSMVGLTQQEVEATLDSNLWLYSATGALDEVSNHDGGYAATFLNGFLGANSAGNGPTLVETNWFGDYFRAWVDSTDPLDGDPAVNGDALVQMGAAYTASGVADYQTNSMYRIDLSNMVTVAPKLSIVSETYTESVNRRIDRGVIRRTTSIEDTSGNGPLKAGPFGSLNKYISLESPLVIYDSIPPKSLGDVPRGYCTTFDHGSESECTAAHEGQWNETKYMVLTTDIPQNYPHEASEDKIRDVIPAEVKVKLYSVPEDPETGPIDTSTSTVDYLSNTEDSAIGSYTWGKSTNPVNEFTEGSLGLVNVSNYIEIDFRGRQSFTKKTLRDLLLGFGNGVSSKNQIRPDLYQEKAWTGATPDKFAVEYKIDPPRGSRFGLYNIGRVSGNYKFSYSHYGHLRDLFEQSIDTKVNGFVRDPEIFGSPVVVNPINPTNPEIPKLMENTSRYNKTVNATIVKPYIEDNYEAIPNPVNLQSETLRVDVAGSIRSKQVLAPGNVASNIRRR